MPGASTATPNARWAIPASAADVQRLRQAPNLAIATMWVDVLRQAGIEASVQRQFLSSAAGELPPDQCLPEIWITHDQQLG